MFKKIDIMQSTKDNKVHIGIYGRRNYGKSSFINTLANQEISIVSNTSGTTTDPVKKSFEILDFGAVVFVDTAGIDDVGELGLKRVKKTLESIQQINLAILVISDNQFSKYEHELISEFKRFDTPFFVVHNKSDLNKLDDTTKSKIIDFTKLQESQVIDFSALTPNSISSIVECIKSTIPDKSMKKPTILNGIVNSGDVVLLITPIDSEAPAGRMILPQVQLIRDVLDNDCICVVVKETEVTTFLNKTALKPSLVITDSQIFDLANKLIPEEIMLTSFSTVLAYYKGEFQKFIEGLSAIDNLSEGDNILVLESCSHHVSCEDIGRFKIPNWLKLYTGKQFNYDVVPGLSNPPKSIADYSLAIQCGGCMITEKQLKNRLKIVTDQNIPVVNYGILIAKMKGILDRAMKPFI